MTNRRIRISRKQLLKRKGKGLAVASGPFHIDPGTQSTVAKIVLGIGGKGEADGR
jgi:hypothetical protein